MVKPNNTALERVMNLNKTGIALINNNISFIQKDISEIKESLKGLPSIFASKEQLIDVAKDTEARLCKLENLTQGPARFSVPIVTAIGSSIVTFLVIQYLEHSVV